MITSSPARLRLRLTLVSRGVSNIQRLKVKAINTRLMSG